jgi:hypothetical protein
VFYVFALTSWLTRKSRTAPWFWTLGFLFYLAHVISAFGFQYDWSHRAAYAETARQTAERFKIRWGGGLYFNYAFTAIWAADVCWMWGQAAGYGRRRRWVKVAVHGFLAFMFFNATVVFASGWVRWLAAGCTVALAILSIRAAASPPELLNPAVHVLRGRGGKGSAESSAPN